MSDEKIEAVLALALASVCNALNLPDTGDCNCSRCRVLYCAKVTALAQGLGMLEAWAEKRGVSPESLALLVERGRRGGRIAVESVAAEMAAEIAGGQVDQADAPDAPDSTTRH